MRIIVEIQTDHIIRIIQHRAWEDFHESLSYEALLLFFAEGNSSVLTPMQMEFVSDLRREIFAAERRVSQGQDRSAVYFDAALITSPEAYRRVFHPEGYDERYGGFADGREAQFCTPAWQEDRTRWEARTAQFLDAWEDEDEKQDKELAPPAAPVRPQTPAVRAFYGWRLLGSNHKEIRRFAVRTA